MSQVYNASSVTASNPAQPRWDIFCSIVDNYGDIGVCWRLARQLAHEHKLQVRLWLDKPEVARQIIPGLNPALVTQTLEQVTICHWPEQSPNTVNTGDTADTADITEVADVVIEAFACELPAAYLQRMQTRRPVWINLEYLSAENWVDGFHGGSSLHAATGLSKHFFFPGFSASTGGLLREANLIQQRMIFQQSAELQAAFWQQIGVVLPSPALKISLFCYPHAPLDSLLHSMTQSRQALHLLVPEGQVASQIQAWLARNADMLKQPEQFSVSIIPFLTQPMYDRLLWACDLNLVRGEDSWIRAIWAGRPLIWQPYFQQEDSHLEKLQAFLQRYCAQTPATLSTEIMAAHQAWNASGYTPQGWQALCAMLPQWQTHAQAYASSLAEQEDLAAKLVIYCKNLF